jgi:predicted RNA-binding protein with PIN domain
MPLIIDGYNLLHASDLFGPQRGPPRLEKSRHALLEFLAGALTARQRTQTTIVFDAGGAASGLPREQRFEGITVLYASRHEDADGLIEELISCSTAPRRLTVVSSDHRVQRAARRRRAVAVDSRAWYMELLRRRRRTRTSESQRKVSNEPPPAGETDYWLKQFGMDTPAKAPGEGQQAPGEQDPGASHEKGEGEDKLIQEAEDLLRRLDDT